MKSYLADLEKRITDVPLETLPYFLGELERLKGEIWIRLLQVQVPQSKTHTGDSQLLTIPQVANKLCIPESRAYELARQHKISSVRIGKYVRVPLNKLAEYERTLSGGEK